MCANMRGSAFICCGIEFPDSLGKYGCPNCHGDNAPVTIRDYEGLAYTQKQRIMSPLKRSKQMTNRIEIQECLGRFSALVDGNQLRSKKNVGIIFKNRASAEKAARKALDKKEGSK